MKKLVFTIAAFMAFATVSGQTIDDLKAEKAVKSDSIKAIQARVDALQGQIDAFPGWKIGMFGTIGASFSGANNWYNQGNPNNTAGNIGITGNAFANLDRDKFFWRNNLNINLQWVKLNDRDNDPAIEDDDFEGTTDAFVLSSLYGYKLTPKFAVSALAEYRTTIINNFNDPGYLDIGIGGTWTPITDLIVVIHPLNYNFVFSDNDAVFESSLGAKILVDYTRQIGAVNFKTNFTTFQSYENGDLSNWTWINSFGYTLWNSIGVGFEFGLRDNKQEGLANAQLTDDTVTFDTLDNDLQTYYLLGLNYSF